MKELSPWRIRRFAENEDIEPEYSQGSQPDEVHLSHYWDIVVKRRRTILLIFLVVFSAGAYFALSATKLYTASATIKIEPQNPQVTGVGALQPSEGLLGEYDYYQTQFALLKSRTLAAMVITDLGLESNKIFTSSRIVSPNPLDHAKSWVFRMLWYFSYYLAPLFQSERETDGSLSLKPTAILDKGEVQLNVAPSLIERYQGFVKIVPISQTRLVNVAFTTPNPALSQLLANVHAQRFVRMSLENRFSLTKDAREFLDQKKSELRKKMETSEAALNGFRRAHGVVSVEKGENIVVDRLLDLNRQLTVARAQRIEAESLYRTVENKNYQDLADIMKQGLVQQLKGNIATLEAERARVATIFKPDHPRIQELGQQITDARQAFNAEIANVVRGIQSGYAAALAKERALQAEADKQQQDALKLKGLGVEYTILQEEVNANRSLYENVLKRLGETNVSNDLAVSNMQITERADKPLGPSSPNVGLFLLASMISGLFFGVGIAFVQEYMDSTVATPIDVWQSVGLSTLGVVPHLKFLDRQQYKTDQINKSYRGLEKSSEVNHAPGAAKELSLSHSPTSVFNESYRTIRTALLLSQPEKHPQVVLLTSPSPGEGKTVTSLNLALALAHDGHSVLLIDGDMRKGCCHTRLGLRNNSGLSNVLTGTLSLQNGIQQTWVSGLSLLSRGVLPPNPGELLDSRKMREIVQQLRHDYNFILIDSPPAVAVSDAAVLSTMSDGVLLVFDGQRTSTVYAQRAVEHLDRVRARLLGVILNAVDLGNPHYSHYRDYGSYYGGPNRDEPIGEVNGNGHRGAVHNFYKLRKFAQIWKPTEYLKSKNITDPRAHARNVEEDRANGCDSGVDVRNVEETNGAVQLEPIEIRPIDTLKELSSEEAESAPVPQQILNRLTEVLTVAIGPIAPMVVRDHIAILGESESAFPKNRMDELLKLIQHEIDELKLGLDITISKEIGIVHIERTTTRRKKRKNEK